MDTIETARLILRPFTSDDLDEFALIGSDPEVMRFIGGGKPQSREQTAARLGGIIEHEKQHGFSPWAAIDKASGALAGFCGLQYLENTAEVEVGYRFAKRFWGMGFASEGAAASLRYGFEQLRLDRIVAVVQAENIASNRVLEKSGLRYMKIARFYNMDLRYYAITREEYERDESAHTENP